VDGWQQGMGYEVERQRVAVRKGSEIIWEEVVRQWVQFGGSIGMLGVRMKAVGVGM